MVGKSLGLTRKLWAGTLAFVAAFTLAIGLSSVAFADDEIAVPSTDKTLHDNGDGSYTLSLSVTGQADSSSESNKANVIIIFDSSGSMDDDVSDTTYTANDTGRYGYVNGTYVQLYRRQGNNYSAINNDTTTGTVYSRSRGAYNQWNYTVYTGQRYVGETTTSNRMVVAKNAVNSLSAELLKQNSIEGQDSDTIEIAIVDFASNVKNTTGTRQWMTTTSQVSTVVTRISASGGTNWEAALESAYTLAQQKRQAQPDETVYVIFVSDGNPTFRLTSYGNNPDDGWNTPSGVHGSGNSDTYGYNLDAAQNSAAKITGADGMELYAVGVFGDVSNMESLGGDYYDASDSQALNEAFSDIIDKITNALNVSDVQISDQITGLTATTLVNNASDFKYYRAGGSYGTFDPENGDYGAKWTTLADDGAEEAHFTEGTGVEWDLGRNFKLEDGVTYTVTFTVWPSQRSYDIIADLNNGLIDFDDLTDAEQSQIEEKDGVYGVKTNPEGGAKITYTVTDETTQKAEPTDHDGNAITWEEDGTYSEDYETDDAVVTINYKKNEDGTYTITKTSVPKAPVVIDNPVNTMGLTKTELDLEKKWEAELDPSQIEDVGGQVVLDLYMDDEVYLSDLKLTKDSGWTHIDTVTIAPGIMVSEDSVAYTEDTQYTHVTVDEKKYVILETGHDYFFQEEDIDSHFELTNYIYHPMLVDGVLYNVEFEKSGDTITGVKTITEMANISATNTIKGGINITKKVVDEEGNEVTDLLNPFSITVTVTAADGSALPLKTANGTSYNIDYRIFYGPNNPKYGTEGVTDLIPGGRSPHIYVRGTSFDEEIYVGDTIRVVNVEDDALYSVTETVPTGYDPEYTVDYLIAYGSQDPDDAEPFPEDEDPSVQGNSASYANITNTYVFGDLEVSKTVEVESGDEEQAKATEFEFTFNLYDEEDGDLLEGKYNYTITKAEGDPKTGVIEVGGTFKLKNGDSIKIEKLPETAYYEVVETEVAGFEAEADGDTGTIEAKKTAEAEFTNTYSVESVKVDPPVQKVLELDEGVTAPDIEGMFTFTISGNPTAAPMPKDGEGNQVTQITNSSEYEREDMPSYYEFGEIEFTAPGTYTYTVSETGSAPGVSNDTGAAADKTIKFTVTDNGEGKLTVTPATDDVAFVITNTYETGELDITKTVVNSADSSDDTAFTFTVTFMAGNDEIEGEFPYTIGSTEGTIESGGTLQLKNGQTAQITGIPNGVSYTVTETNQAGYTITSKTGDTGTIDEEEAQTAAFTNTYGASGSVQLSATKAIDGAGWPEDADGNAKTLTFTLSGSGGTLPTTTTQSLTEPDTVTFDAITYSVEDAGQTYTYTITEDGFGAGWTPSPAASITAKVKVTNAGGGELATEVTYSTDGETFTSEVPTITNTYSASGEVPLTVTKAIAGAAWPSGEILTFTLSGEGGTLPETTTATLSSAGTVTFDPIKYTAADVADSPYTYTITEDGFGDGWTATPEDKYITATVTLEDDGEGHITATPSYTNNDTITNTYASSGTVDLVAKKVLEGRDWVGSIDTYTFTLYDGDGDKVEEVTVTSANKDNVEFATLTYNQDDVANSPLTYTISETGTLPAKVKKSDDITVTVTLEDDGKGHITATPSYTNNDTIINTYTPTATEAVIEVTKTIDQYITGSDKTFNFTLTPIEGAPMPEGMTELTTSIETKNGTGTASFDAIDYTAAGTFQYKVVEETDTAPGWSYGVDNTKEYTVTVTVSDDPETGKLSAEISYGADKTSVDVHNLFQETATDVTLKVKKTIVDESDSAQDATFTFTLTPIEGAPLPDDKTELTASIETENLEGEAQFDPITFEQSGKYVYTIVETLEGEAPAGWTYDDREYTVTIEVSDNFDTAVLTSETSIKVDDETVTEIAFENHYKAKSVKAALEVTKEIEDTSGSAPETTFEFTLAGDDPLPEVKTKSIKGAGTVTFDAVEYTKAGTYNYTITEKNGGEAGWSYDTTTYNVVVTVEDNKGQLEATAAYGKESETSLTITNTYAPEPATATPKALKKVDDQSNSAPSETFTFQLIDPDDKLVEEKTRKDGGPVEFTEIEFTKIGTFVYKIKEVAGSTAGYTYDESEHTVTIEVVDNKGTLEATVTSDEDDQAVITNEYKAEPVEVSLEGEKQITGKALTEGEFTFELFDNDDNQVEGTFTNAADGTIDFGSYTFEQAGTYVYTAKEVKGSDTHVTYDQAEHKFTIKVTDNNGALTAEVTAEDGAAVVFENTYTPEPVIIDPPVEKKITGDTPETAATFTFKLTGTDGTELTVTTTGAEKKEFGEIKLSEPGTYEYEITEEAGSVEGYTYDSTVYTLTVVVTANDDGTLSKTETVKTSDGKTATIDDIVFTNKYKKPEEKIIPKTGDSIPVMPLVALVALSGAGIAIATVKRNSSARRRRY